MKLYTLTLDKHRISKILLPKFTIETVSTKICRFNLCSLIRKYEKLFRKFCKEDDFALKIKRIHKTHNLHIILLFRFTLWVKSFYVQSIICNMNLFFINNEQLFSSRKYYAAPTQVVQLLSLIIKHKGTGCISSIQ